jgi:hypothetical protein
LEIIAKNAINENIAIKLTIAGKTYFDLKIGKLSMLTVVIKA